MKRRPSKAKLALCGHQSVEEERVPLFIRPARERRQGGGSWHFRWGWHENHNAHEGPQELQGGYGPEGLAARKGLSRVAPIQSDRKPFAFPRTSLRSAPPSADAYHFAICLGVGAKQLSEVGRPCPAGGNPGPLELTGDAAQCDKQHRGDLRP